MARIAQTNLFVPDQCGIGFGPSVHPHGKRSLADPPGSCHPVDTADLLLESGCDHTALQGLLAVDAVDEDRCRLLAQRADEPGDESVLECLLGEDQEDQQPHCGDEQTEAHPGSGHLA